MKNYLLLFTAFLMVFLASCTKDDPEVVNDEELITTLRYVLNPVGGGTSVTFEFKDLDGDGGEAPIITSGKLKSNTEYTGTLTLLNESETPAEDITEEIEEEDDAHQFFFIVTNDLVTVSYDDADGDGNPIGIKSKISTGAAGSGTLSIVLRHEPDKSGANVKSGDITNAGGETDIEVVFPIEVED